MRCIFIPFYLLRERVIYTLRHGLLHRYFVMGIPQPQIDNVQLVHAF